MKRSGLLKKASSLGESGSDRSRMKRQADRWFSQYIRKRAANSHGVARCVTCGTCALWDWLHCGHFMGRRKDVLRYDERAAYPQCAICNTHKDGARDAMAAHIDRVHGCGTAEALELMSNTENAKFTAADLGAIADKYRQLFKQL